MKRWLIVPIGAALAVLGFAAFRSASIPPVHERARTTVTAQDPASPLELVQAELARLRRENQETRRLAQEATRRAEPEQQAPAPEPESSATPGEDPMEKQRLAVEDLTGRLEARFAEQAFDSSFSNGMERALQQELATGTGSTLLEARCAASLCRVVLEHESAEAQRSVASRVSQLAPLRFGVFYSYDTSSNPPHTTLYVVREGQDVNELIGS